jgi:hypothetical protein
VRLKLQQESCTRLRTAAERDEERHDGSANAERCGRVRMQSAVAECERREQTQSAVAECDDQSPFTVVVTLVFFASLPVSALASPPASASLLVWRECGCKYEWVSEWVSA